MDMLGVLCIFGFLALLALMILPRFFGGWGGGGGYYGRPTYRRSFWGGGWGGRGRGGWFGRGGGNYGGSPFVGPVQREEPRDFGGARSYDSPRIQSRGGFGGSRASGGGGGARSYNSPRIQSRGGFSGSKK